MPIRNIRHKQSLERKHWSVWFESWSNCDHKSRLTESGTSTQPSCIPIHKNVTCIYDTALGGTSPLTRKHGNIYIYMYYYGILWLMFIAVYLFQLQIKNFTDAPAPDSWLCFQITRKVSPVFLLGASVVQEVFRYFILFNFPRVTDIAQIIDCIVVKPQGECFFLHFVCNVWYIFQRE